MCHTIVSYVSLCVIRLYWTFCQIAISGTPSSNMTNKLEERFVLYSSYCASGPLHSSSLYWPIVPIAITPTPPPLLHYSLLPLALHSHSFSGLLMIYYCIPFPFYISHKFAWLLWTYKSLKSYKSYPICRLRQNKNFPWPQFKFF